MSSTPLNFLYHPSLFFNKQESPKNDAGSFLGFLSLLQIPYTLEKYNKHTNGIMYCNLTYSPDNNNQVVEFDMFSDILKEIAHTNIQLLLWQPYESFGYLNPVHTEQWEKNLQVLSNTGFPAEKILYVSGDILSKDTTNKDYNNINRLGVDAFPFVTARRYNFKPRDIRTKNKKKKFLCLNKLPRPHRSALYYYLTKNNLIESSIFSWNDKWNILSENDAKEFTFDNSELHKIKKLPTIKLANDKGPNLGYQDLSWYDDTVFSLVTETSVTANTLFLTEKIYKPIMIGHPFVVWGNPGTLKYLQEEGYKTFPELFDETYDLEENNSKRLQKIIDICKNVKIQDWPQSVVDKIEHNKNLFRQNWRKKFVDMNQTIVKTLISNENSIKNTK